MAPFSSPPKHLGVVTGVKGRGRRAMEGDVAVGAFRGFSQDLAVFGFLFLSSMFVSRKAWFWIISVFDHFSLLFNPGRCGVFPYTSSRVQRREMGKGVVRKRMRGRGTKLGPW